MKFEDRISEYPGRIKLTEENGEAHYYTLERADEPTQPGTPLSAENLNKLTQDVNGKTGASIVLTGDDIAISASDNTTVKERVDNVWSAASTAQSTADKALSSGLKKELLWSNSNTSAPFNDQLIYINASKYSTLIIVMRQDITHDFYYNFYVNTDKNIRIVLSGVNYNDFKIMSRDVSVASNNLNISGGYKASTYGTYAETNDVLIPYKIYGVK